MAIKCVKEDKETGYQRIENDEGLWGLADQDNIFIVSYKYQYIAPFVNGFARVKNEDGWGFIDTNGVEVIKCQYYFVYDFYEERAIVYDGRYFGSIDTSGKEVIPRKFDYLGNFYEGLTYSCIDAEYFYVDRDGNYVCDELQKPHARTRK